jgi:putative ABC transport system substrate-binding protein
MKKKVTILALCAMLFAVCPPAQAQQPAKIPRIGYLGATSVSARTEAFRQGLRELGYMEGKTSSLSIQTRGELWLTVRQNLCVSRWT